MDDNKELWERLTAVEQSAKSAHHRIDHVEKLAESVYVLATETKNMRADLNDVINRLSVIEARPGKRYDAIVAALISSVIGVVVGYFL